MKSSVWTPLREGAEELLNGRPLVEITKKDARIMSFDVFHKAMLDGSYELAQEYAVEHYDEFPDFTDEEIETNWGMVISNKVVLDSALAEGKPPTPFMHCYDWECNYCRYKLVCETLVRLKPKEESNGL